MSGPEIGVWHIGTAVAGPLFAFGALYFWGVVRLWRNAGVARGITLVHVMLFSLGWLALAVVLISPLHHLAEHLFTAHMVEHEILMAVAPPLLLLSHPLAAFAWSMPAVARRISKPWRTLSLAWDAMTHPTVATLLHAVAIWTWHVPVLFRLALEHEGLHWLQHASFFGTGLLFWWSIYRSSQSGRGAAVGHLFVTSMHTGLLGALLVLSHRSFYPAPDGIFGLSPLEDQQLGGLIMWVPGCAIYAVAALVFAARWIVASGARQSGMAFLEMTERS